MSSFFFLRRFFFWQTLFQNSSFSSSSSSGKRFFKMLLFQDASCDFDQTWSEGPLTQASSRVFSVWGQRSCRGHEGSFHDFGGKIFKMLLLLQIRCAGDETCAKASPINSVYRVLSDLISQLIKYSKWRII